MGVKITPPPDYSLHLSGLKYLLCFTTQYNPSEDPENLRRKPLDSGISEDTGVTCHFGRQDRFPGTPVVGDLHTQRGEESLGSTLACRLSVSTRLSSERPTLPLSPPFHFHKGGRKPEPQTDASRRSLSKEGPFPDPGLQED